MLGPHNVIARARYALPLVPNRCLADDRSLSLALATKTEVHLWRETPSQCPVWLWLAKMQTTFGAREPCCAVRHSHCFRLEAGARGPGARRIFFLE